jgi:hypothetical protein
VLFVAHTLLAVAAFGLSAVAATRVTSVATVSRSS